VVLPRHSNQRFVMTENVGGSMLLELALVVSVAQYEYDHNPDLRTLVTVGARSGTVRLETIHPFPDGNGRTGRAIVQCLLRGKRLTRKVTIPVSAGLLTDTERYFDALTAYRAGDIQPIVERFAEASFDSIINGRQLVTELRAIRAAWSDSITSRRQAIVWRALDVVFQHPVLDNALVQRELDVSAMGAEAAITELVEVGALQEVTGGRRNRQYAAVSVLAALDAFGERAGRRTPATP